MVKLTRVLLHLPFVGCHMLPCFWRLLLQPSREEVLASGLHLKLPRYIEREDLPSKGAPLVCRVLMSVLLPRNSKQLKSMPFPLA